MPLFEVSVTRRVTERADVEVEAATAEDARAQIEADLHRAQGAWDYDWSVCDCQDDGDVSHVKEKKATA